MEYLDNQGYPTDEFLDYLSDWEKFEDVFEIIELIETYWWMPDWGLTRKKPYTERFTNQRVFTYHMSTGGWSGNESLIYALKKNVLFWVYWRNTRCGGHYTFRFPVNNK